MSSYSEKKLEKHSSAKEFLTIYQSTLKIQSKSIIATIFGDIVLPYGGNIWLKNLSLLAEPLGINERSVRTGLFRLNEEEWVFGTRLGRKSFYQLTDSASEQTQQISSFIYHQNNTEWDKSWLIVFLAIKSIDKKARSKLEQELQWMGFGSVSQHVWAHPQGSIEHLESRILKLGLESQVVCMQANNIYHKESGLSLNDTQLAQLCSPTERVEKEYQSFINNMSPLAEAMDSLLLSAQKSELTALRILLIDQFRHAVLHDPHLPKQLLPNDWIGNTAWTLCQEIYQKLLAPTNAYYVELSMKGVDGLYNQERQLLLDKKYLNRFINE